MSSEESQQQLPGGAAAATTTAAAVSGSGSGGGFGDNHNNDDVVDIGDSGDRPNIQVGQFKINGTTKQFAIVPRSRLHSRQHLRILLHDYWNLSTPSFIIETNSSNRDLENTITTSNTKHFLQRIYPDLTSSYGNTGSNKDINVGVIGTQTSARSSGGGGDGDGDDYNNYEESTESFTTTSRMSNILGRPSQIGQRNTSTTSSARRSEPSLGTTPEEEGKQQEQEQGGGEDETTQSSTGVAADDFAANRTEASGGNDNKDAAAPPSPSNSSGAGYVGATARPTTSSSKRQEESYQYRISHGFAPKSVRDSFMKFYDRVHYMPPVKQRMLNHYEWVEFSNTYLSQKLDKCLSSIVSAADMTNGWILCRGPPSTNEKLFETAMESSRAHPNVLVVDDNTYYKYPKVLRELNKKKDQMVNLKDALDLSKPVTIIPIDCGNDWIDNYDIKRRYGQQNGTSQPHDGDNTTTAAGKKYLWNDNKKLVSSSQPTGTTTTTADVKDGDGKKQKMKKRYKPYLGARWEALFPWKIGNYFIFTDDCENFNADLIGPSGYIAINGNSNIQRRPTTTTAATASSSSHSGTTHTMNFNEVGFSTGYLIREAVARTRPCIIFDNTGRDAQKYARLIREIKWRDELDKKIHQLEKMEQEPGFQHIVKKNRESLFRRLILGLDRHNMANKHNHNRTDKLRFRFSDFDDDLKGEILKSSVERLLDCLDKDLTYYQRELDFVSKTFSRRVIQTWKWLWTFWCGCCGCGCDSSGGGWGGTAAITGNAEDKEDRTEEEDYKELRKELKRYAG